MSEKERERLNIGGQKIPLLEVCVRSRRGTLREEVEQSLSALEHTAQHAAHLSGTLETGTQL